MAVYRGPEMPVFVRVAELEGDVYVDLGGAEWSAARVTCDGWTVVADPPVRFVRKAGFAPLPYPVAGGTIDELRPFLNVGGDGDFMLLVARRPQRRRQAAQPAAQRLRAAGPGPRALDVIIRVEAEVLEQSGCRAAPLPH